MAEKPRFGSHGCEDSQHHACGFPKLTPEEAEMLIPAFQRVLGEQEGFEELPFPPTPETIEMVVRRDQSDIESFLRKRAKPGSYAHPDTPKR